MLDRLRADKTTLPQVDGLRASATDRRTPSTAPARWEPFRSVEFFLTAHADRGPFSRGLNLQQSPPMSTQARRPQGSLLPSGRARLGDHRRFVRGLFGLPARHGVGGGRAHAPSAQTLAGRNEPPDLAEWTRGPAPPPSRAPGPSSTRAADPSDSATAEVEFLRLPLTVPTASRAVSASTRRDHGREQAGGDRRALARGTAWPARHHLTWDAEGSLAGPARERPATTSSGSAPPAGITGFRQTDRGAVDPNLRFANPLCDPSCHRAGVRLVSSYLDRRVRRRAHRGLQLLPGADAI